MNLRPKEGIFRAPDPMPVRIVIHVAAKETGLALPYLAALRIVVNFAAEEARTALSNLTPLFIVMHRRAK